MFAIRVSANGKRFPQGVGTTKKEAKTAAAKIALNILLGLGEDGLDEEGERKIEFPIIIMMTIIAWMRNYHCFCCLLTFILLSFL